jgi:hypothetical protein
MDKELSSFSCLVVFGLWILLASNSSISVSLYFYVVLVGEEPSRTASFLKLCISIVL